MAITGLGEGGYVQIQKEVTWGTAVSNSMTLIAASPDSTFEFHPTEIENNTMVSSRLKQNPSVGRTLCKFTLKTRLEPTQIGVLMNLLLGTSADAGPTDSTYTHTWLTPITGTRIAKSFTMEVAIGYDTAIQMAGCMFTKFNLSTDSEGYIMLTLSGVAKLYTTGVARIASFSYPTKNPLIFSNIVLNLNPGSGFDQPCNSIELDIDMGYKEENFKTGSIYTNQPLFEKPLTVMLKCNIEADKQFREAAQAFTYYDNLITITSLEYAAGTTTLKTFFELPKGKLKPDTNIPFTKGLTTMDLEFDHSYGDTTTGSSSALVNAEVRVVDAVAAYA